MRERHDMRSRDIWFLILTKKIAVLIFFCQVRQRRECHHILCIVPWAWKPVKRCNARTKKPSIKCVFSKINKKLARGRREAGTYWDIIKNSRNYLFQILWKSWCHILVLFSISVLKNYVLYWDFVSKIWIIVFSQVKDNHHCKCYKVQALQYPR